MTSIEAPQVVSIDKACTILNGCSHPFVFIDACSFLDILRIPVPERKHSIDLLLSLLTIKSFIVSGQFLSFSSALCIKEYGDHADKIVQSLPDQIKNIQKPVHTLIDFINQSGLSGAPITKSDLSNLQIERFFIDIVEVICRHTMFIEVSQDFKNQAYTRLVDKRPPAHSKGEYKDCIIWETFLSLRTMQIDKSKPAFFLSSNKRDYCEPPLSWDFHPKLLSEVGTLNALYTADYSALAARLEELKVFQTL